MFEFEEKSFEIIQQPNNSEKKRIEIKKAEGIIPGHPLKDQGICNHYKRSHRWLRFPCCGLAYPCDQCHDKNENHPHEVLL